jgi:hypothetical protein
LNNNKRPSASTASTRTLSPLVARRDSYENAESSSSSEQPQRLAAYPLVADSGTDNALSSDEDAVIDVDDSDDTDDTDIDASPNDGTLQLAERPVIIINEAWVRILLHLEADGAIQFLSN